MDPSRQTLNAPRFTLMCPGAWALVAKMVQNRTIVLF
jgi:hypothetical protein